MKLSLLKKRLTHVICDKDKTEILQAYQLTELCYFVDVVPHDNNTTYLLSFYRPKTHYNTSNPWLKIYALISQSESRHEVLYTIDISL